VSYLTDLIHKRIDAAKFLGQSVHFLKDKLGISVNDATVDAAVKASDKLTDVIEAAVKTYIATTLPQLPAALATSAATAVLHHLDAAIAGAGNVIKDNN
jgi:hypothetical protein